MSTYRFIAKLKAAVVLSSVFIALAPASILGQSKSVSDIIQIQEEINKIKTRRDAERADRNNNLKKRILDLDSKAVSNADKARLLGKLDEKKAAARAIDFGGGWSLAPGIMYLAGKGTGNYTSSAFIDGYGFVRAEEDLRRVTRVFPSATVVHTYGGDQWYSPLSIGISFGVNEGINNADNSGRGFAVAGGLFLGVYKRGGAHIGVFMGSILDPSVRVLPAYSPLGLPFPDHDVQERLKADRMSTETAIATTVASKIEIPTVGTQGVYDSVGIVFSYAFETAPN